MNTENANEVGSEILDLFEIWPPDYHRNYQIFGTYNFQYSSFLILVICKEPMRVVHNQSSLYFTGLSHQCDKYDNLVKKN